MRLVPYPADTKAKGWRFELDLERVMQSDTWALATPDIRPWLLMLWTTAWQQNPCGSMPSDDTLLAARLGMAPKAFQKAKAVLLRGWWLAEDGRLYHDTIVERVLAMLSSKEGERKRKADYRAKQDAERKALQSGNFPQMSHGTDSGQTRDSSGIDATGTSTSTRTGITKEQCVGIPAHTLPDSFKTEIQKTRPDLNPEIVWGVFVQKTNPRDQTLAVWKSWIARERAPVQLSSDGVSDPDSKASIEARGIAFGLGSWDGLKEPWVAYKARVLSAKTMEAA